MGDAGRDAYVRFRLDAIARWRDLPNPPPAAFAFEADDEAWRSSA